MKINHAESGEKSTEDDYSFPYPEETVAQMCNLIWADSKVRSHIQEKYGFSIVPSNFYSNIPSIKDVMESFEYRGDGYLYDQHGLFNKEGMLNILSMLNKYSKEFNPATKGSETDCRKFFWENSQFSFSDAMAYYAFVRAYKPNRIFEIGSGFSTLVAIDAINKNKIGEITCIEPFPRNFLESLDVKLIRKKVQDISVDELIAPIENGDFLFIDSTHTVKLGSDCLKIYLDLIPRIKKNIFIHVHDIFLPYAMPKSWATDLHIYWTEQYLLLAFLIDNPKIEIMFGSKYHEEKNYAALNCFMGGKWAPGGSSFWFKYNGESCQ